jgi:predicted N-acyltransferase
MIAEQTNLTTHLPQTHKLQDLRGLWVHGIDTTVQTFETISTTYANTTTTYIGRPYEVLTRPNYIRQEKLVLGWYLAG